MNELFILKVALKYFKYGMHIILVTAYMFVQSSSFAEIMFIASH